MASHNKSILYEVPQHVGRTGNALEKENFHESINQQGYDVTIEKSLRCPCVSKTHGQALSSCVNCGGTGWIFINKRETVAVLTNMNRSTKFKSWTEYDRGTVSVSLKSWDAIGFMDRIVNLNLLSTYSQVVHLKECNDGEGGTEMAGMLVYPPQDVENCFLFDDDALPLRSLVEGTDFTISGQKFILSDSVDIGGQTEPTVSVRYEHYPVFHVIDIMREKISSRREKCVDGTLFLDGLPIHCIARRTHYLMDAPGKDGVGYQDNSSLDNEDLRSNHGILQSL